jgi:hypothetical protein
MAPLYENRRGDDRNAETTFLARPQAGRAGSGVGSSYSKNDDPYSKGDSYSNTDTFTSLLPDRLGSEPAARALDADRGFDFSRAGAELIRSQSAAPTFHGRNPLFPPPGLANIKESQPTPSTVDSYSTSSHGTNNYESAVDRAADIMRLGQVRSASTGVIGSYGSPMAGAGGGLRPSQGPLMGLIEEDDVQEVNRGGVGPHDNFDHYHNSRDHNRHQQTQNSTHMQRRPGGEPEYVYAQQHLPPQQQHPHHMQLQPPLQQHHMQPQYMQLPDMHQEPRMQQQRPPMRTARDVYEIQVPMVNWSSLESLAFNFG